MNNDLKQVIYISISKAQQKAVAKYTKTNYDEIKLRVPKGRKEKIKEVAESQGKTLNKFIIEAINLHMSRYVEKSPDTEPDTSADQIEE